MGTKMMTPFERGYLAAEVGMPITACPYHSQSGEAISWRSGYRALLERIKVSQADTEDASKAEFLAYGRPENA